MTGRGWGNCKRNVEGPGKLWPSLSSLDHGHKDEHSLAGLCGFDPLSLLIVQATQVSASFSIG